MKYSGMIGYVETVETEPGITEAVVTERFYKGDVLRNNRTWDTNQNSTNDNINISNQISIISDSYAAEHLQFMRYVVWMGLKWKITNININYPRYILTVGGAYNGYENSTP